MKTIYFKNGSRKTVSQEIANIICMRVQEGCGTFQCFSDEKDVILIINLSEVVFID